MNNKIISVLLFSTLFFVLQSCHNILDDSIDKSMKNSEVLSTRSSSSNDVLSQATGIPVRLVLPKGVISNNSEYYFSSRWNESNTILSSIDDGSGRQQFTINKANSNNGYYIDNKGGSYSGGKYFTVVDDAHLRFTNTLPRTIWQIEPIPNTAKCRIYYITKNNQRLYLRGYQENSDHTRFDQAINKFGEWEITPIEDVKIVDIKYELNLSNGDKITPRYKSITTYRIPNGQNPNPVAKSYENQVNVTERSSFSVTEGLSIATKVGVSVGIDIPKIVDAKINTEISTSKSWAYSQGKEEVKSRTEKVTFSTTIPAYHDAVINVYLVEYEANVTYVATMETLISKKTFQVKGKWAGVIVSEICYEPIITPVGGISQKLETKTFLLLK